MQAISARAESISAEPGEIWLLEPVWLKFAGSLLGFKWTRDVGVRPLKGIGSSLDIRAREHLTSDNQSQQVEYARGVPRARLQGISMGSKPPEKRHSLPSITMPAMCSMWSFVSLSGE